MTVEKIIDQFIKNAEDSWSFVFDDKQEFETFICFERDGLSYEIYLCAEFVVTRNYKWAGDYYNPPEGIFEGYFKNAEVHAYACDENDNEFEDIELNKVLEAELNKTTYEDSY